MINIDLEPLKNKINNFIAYIHNTCDNHNIAKPTSISIGSDLSSISCFWNMSDLKKRYYISLSFLELSSFEENKDNFTYKEYIISDKCPLIMNEYVKIQDIISKISSCLSENNKKTCRLYTDGACSGNPGPGGWAYIIVEDNGNEKVGSGRESQSTNQRMELVSVINGLQSCKNYDKVSLYSDSQYVIKGLNEWLISWKKNGWKTANKKPVANQDLWIQLDSLISKIKIGSFWIKGHNGDSYNERCDKIAVAESLKK